MDGVLDYTLALLSLSINGLQRPPWTHCWTIRKPATACTALCNADPEQSLDACCMASDTEILQILICVCSTGQYTEKIVLLQGKIYSVTFPEVVTISIVLQYKIQDYGPPVSSALAEFTPSIIRRVQARVAYHIPRGLYWCGKDKGRRSSSPRRWEYSSSRAKAAKRPLWSRAEGESQDIRVTGSRL